MFHCSSKHTHSHVKVKSNKIPENLAELLPFVISLAFPVSSTSSAIDPFSQPNIPNELLSELFKCTN